MIRICFGIFVSACLVGLFCDEASAAGRQCGRRSWRHTTYCQRPVGCNSACGGCSTIATSGNCCGNVSTPGLAVGTGSTTSTSGTETTDSTPVVPAPTAKEMEMWEFLVKNGYEQKDFNLVWVGSTPAKRQEMYDQIVKTVKDAEEKAQQDQAAKDAEKKDTEKKDDDK